MKNPQGEPQPPQYRRQPDPSHQPDQGKWGRPSQSGYQNPPSGYQNSPSGYQDQRGGYQASQGGYQNPQGGYQGPPSGFQGPPSGYQAPPPGGGPDDFNDEQEDEPRQGTSVLVIVLVILAVLAVAAFAAFVYLGSNRDDSQSGGSSNPATTSAQRTEDSGVASEKTADESTETDEETEAPEGEERPEHPRLPGNAEAVNDAAKNDEPAGNLNSVWKSGPTSDEFALDVRDAYVDAYLDGEPDQFDHDVEVRSRVTGQSYPMTCRDNGKYVHCTGGNDANVYIA